MFLVFGGSGKPITGQETIETSFFPAYGLSVSVGIARAISREKGRFLFTISGANNEAVLSYQNR